MRSFISVVKKTKKEAFYITIPREIIKKLKLKPFMAGKIQAEKNSIKIFDFERTVKTKMDMQEKTLALLKKIMKIEGYASLDETISNAIHEFFEKNNQNRTHVVYIYPEEFLKSKCILIDEFEKKGGKNEEKPS